MLVTNIDELFDNPDDFAAASSRPGVLDLCFNAGLLVFRPDSSYHREIMKLWWDTTEKDTCPNDQVLLLQYYVDAGNWKVLSYTYKAHEVLSLPVIACCTPPKQWSANCLRSRKEVSDFNGRPILQCNC